MDTITYEIADLENTEQADAVKFLLNEYARDLKGYHKALPANVLKALIPGLKKYDHLIILAKVDRNYAGMAICFVSFSTFYAKPILNIHDLTVLKDHRRKAIATGLLDVIESRAKKMKCCKITLEVQEKNAAALGMYEKNGFNKYGYDPEEGKALFLMKIL